MMKAAISGQGYVEKRFAKARDHTGGPSTVSAKVSASKNHGSCNFGAVGIFEFVHMFGSNVSNDIVGGKFIFAFNVGAVEGSEFAIIFVHFLLTELDFFFTTEIFVLAWDRQEMDGFFGIQISNFHITFSANWAIADFESANVTCNMAISTLHYRWERNS